MPPRRYYKCRDARASLILHSSGGTIFTLIVLVVEASIASQFSQRSSRADARRRPWLTSTGNNMTAEESQPTTWNKSWWYGFRTEAALFAMLTLVYAMDEFKVFPENPRHPLHILTGISLALQRP